MISAAEARSGKTARDENFPVASWLISRSFRPVILAFYRFVRVADDVADQPRLSAAEKVIRRYPFRKPTGLRWRCGATRALPRPSQPRSESSLAAPEALSSSAPLLFRKSPTLVLLLKSRRFMLWPAGSLLVCSNAIR